ncbi:phage integrase Arm DNA-binding domain-containing protein [Scandinavium sp. TWS1a]|uniref:tyrosine-type recombinase/integrase n=1 Tax=Scandinavium tedordense TaxID=2926521 RepID=UPI0021666DB5|nr:tyrosine-type recombinase/integrase [Scandinavium tedordense]MCS2173082.1 phage integrase Arm DNA-binding domain-containing protein [Scandinavium tedordense]
MARPRTHNIDIPNLYRKLDKRNGKTYWQYFNQLDGKFSSLGRDEALAKTAALKLNRVIAQKQVEHAYSLVDSVLGRDKPECSKIRLHAWIDRYFDLLDKRLERGELAASTIRSRKFSARLLRDKSSNMYLENVGAREMAAILEEYKNEDKNLTANQHRSNWMDLFKEAQYAGEVPPGFNPALATRKVSFQIRRGRLEFKQWQRIYEAAGNWAHWAQCCLLLSLVTGQRPGDVIKMKFSDVWDDYLHIEQEKTGHKIALPLSLHCEAISMNLGQAIKFCRDGILSHFMVHHSTSYRRAKVGGQLSRTTVSKMFCDLRNELGIEAEEGKTPPTFYEQRSLAERLYEKQGIDTQLLLGHSTAAMTARYHDDRRND